MIDDPYADDFSDPFVDGNDPYGPDWMPPDHPARRSLSASKVGLGLLGVALIVALAAGGYALTRRVLVSPADVVQSFYTHLNDRDLAGAAALIDPAEGISAGTLESMPAMLDLVLELLGDEMLAEFDIDADFLTSLIEGVGWQFLDMEYTLLTSDSVRATVHASGQLILTVLGVDFPLPWNLTHELIRRERRWYLSFGLQSLQ